MRRDIRAKLDFLHQSGEIPSRCIFAGLASLAMRILIEGIGGIGGVVSARLTEAGYAPVLVTHNPAITEAVNREGMRLKTTEGASTTAAKAFSFLVELPQGSQFDVAFLVMKANQVVVAARQSLPLLGRSGYLVTFQNGIVEDAVAEVAGAGQV